MTDEVPAQTFERIYRQPWPGGDSEIIASLLKFFGITYVPGTEQANLALQEKLLALNRFSVKVQPVSGMTEAQKTARVAPVVTLVVTPHGSPLHSPSPDCIYCEASFLRVEVNRLTSRAAELEEKRKQLKNDCANAHEARRQTEAEVRRLTLRLNSAEERSKACDQIADGDEGWQILRNLCVSTMSVASLRDRHDQLRAALARYGRHTKACDFLDPLNPSGACTCGYSKALGTPP